MAVQIVPLLKVLAPYVTQIATTAIPAFTSRPKESKKDDPLYSKQIEELQTAVTDNAESIKILAGNLAKTIEGIEKTAVEMKQKILFYKILFFISLAFSVGSFAFSGFLR